MTIMANIKERNKTWTDTIKNAKAEDMARVLRICLNAASNGRMVEIDHAGNTSAYLIHGGCVNNSILYMFIYENL